MQKFTKNILCENIYKIRRGNTFGFRLNTHNSKKVLTIGINCANILKYQGKLLGFCPFVFVRRTHLGKMCMKLQNHENCLKLFLIHR